MILANPEEYYADKDGRIVFKKEYHLRRGSCCNNNCKHCPYKNKN